MRLIADDDNRVPGVTVVARAAPELNLVDQAADQSNHNRQDV